MIFVLAVLATLGLWVLASPGYHRNTDNESYKTYGEEYRDDC